MNRRIYIILKILCVRASLTTIVLRDEFPGNFSSPNWSFQHRRRNCYVTVECWTVQSWFHHNFFESVEFWIPDVTCLEGIILSRLHKNNIRVTVTTLFRITLWDREATNAEETANTCYSELQRVIFRPNGTLPCNLCKLTGQFQWSHNFKEIVSRQLDKALRQTRYFDVFCFLNGPPEITAFGGQIMKYSLSSK